MVAARPAPLVSPSHAIYTLRYASQSGRTALLKAALYEHHDVAVLLLAQPGIDVNAVSNVRARCRSTAAGVPLRSVLPGERVRSAVRVDHGQRGVAGKKESSVSAYTAHAVAAMLTPPQWPLYWRWLMKKWKRYALL